MTRRWKLWIDLRWDWGYLSIMVQLGMPENPWHYGQKRLHEHVVVLIVVVVVAVACCCCFAAKIGFFPLILEIFGKTCENQRINSAGRFWSGPNCIMSTTWARWCTRRHDADDADWDAGYCGFDTDPAKRSGWTWQTVIGCEGDQDALQVLWYYMYIIHMFCKFGMHTLRRR